MKNLNWRFKRVPLVALTLTALVLVSCVGSKKAKAPAPSKPRTFSFIDETGLKRFLEIELEAPMGSLTSVACKKSPNWKCKAVLHGEVAVDLTPDQSVLLLAKHIFAKRADLLLGLNDFEFSFLGCLDKRGRVHCRIEGLVDHSKKR